tara:strand:- start:614 stop:1183 length:570 start_codon:yes stop_codon:yes gene_type:complete
MSTLKANAVTTLDNNTDLTITGGGTGVPNLEAGTKLNGTALTSTFVQPSANVPDVAPGTNGNLLTSNGSAWTSAAAAGGATIGTPLVMSPFAKNTSASQAHGLGAVFDNVLIEWECLTANNNWVVGNKLISSLHTGSTADGSIVVIKDATNITAVVSNATFTLPNKTTFATFGVNVANWKVTLTPYITG